MVTLTDFLQSTIILLAIAISALMVYFWFLTRRPSQQSHTGSYQSEITKSFLQINQSSPTILPFHEYKKRYATRVREIAILSATRSDTIDYFREEFIETLKEHGSLVYHFTEYNANGNGNITQKLMEEIIQRDYDLILAVGMYAADAAKHVTMSRNKLVPTVFAGIRDTWWEEKEAEQTAPHMTGIVGSGGWELRAILFLQSKPSMKSALIIYSEYLVDELHVVTEMLKQKNISYYLLQPTSTKDVVEALKNYVSKIDSIITLRDSFSSQVADQIANFCDTHGISFFSSNIGNVDKGAAMGVSLCRTHMGIDAAHKARMILEEHKHPSHIPISHIVPENEYEVKFNQEAMRRQNIDPAIIPQIALTYGKAVHIPVEKQMKVNGYIPKDIL